MIRWKKAAAAAAIALTATLIMTSCAGGGSDAGGGDSSTADKLTLTAVASPTSYDISQGGEWANKSQFFEAVFDTIIHGDAKGELEPGLAESWEYNADNTVLTLTLREDATFTDGTPVDAEAVVGSLEYFRDGTAPQAGAMAGNEYSMLDEKTVVITMTAPNPGLLNLLSGAPGLVQAPSTFGQEEAATVPVGSGPYILDTAASVNGTVYVYSANPDYWNKDAVVYDNLTINVIEDPTATLNAIKAGEANGAKIVNNNSLEEVEASGWTIESNQLDFQGLMLLDRAGTMAPELADVNVRRAINMAFDRQALIDALQSGHGVATEQVFPERSVAFDAALDDTYGYDPKAAKALLAEAGYPNGFTLSMMSTPAYQTTFDLVAQQLLDIGITVNFTDPGMGNFVPDILAAKYPATWILLQQDPDWQLVNFMIAPNATFNPFKSQDPQVDEYIKAMQFGTEDEATQAVKDLNAFMVDQAWFAPFFRVQGSYAVDANTALEFWPTNAYPSIFGFSPKN